MDQEVEGSGRRRRELGRLQSSREKMETLAVLREEAEEGAVLQ